MKGQPLMVLEGVEKTYVLGGQSVPVLRGVDLSISEGEYVAIVGPSGSGKSTLMHILGCLDVPSGGRYRLLGTEVGGLGDDALAALRNRALGFVFQAFYLLPRMTALENVELPLMYRGVPARERRRRAQAALERMGLGHRLQHRPFELSGGQQQRVAIARAIVGDPVVILADEPTGALDSQASADILRLFDELHQEGRTLILVTHAPEVAARAGRVVEVLDGRIRADRRQAAAVSERVTTG